MNGSILCHGFDSKGLLHSRCPICGMTSDLISALPSLLLPRTPTGSDMLVLHSSSSCDVCMEDYDLDILAKSPHAINCGHIFCQSCISAFTPSICPICRTDFQRQNVRRLHVDPGEDNAPPSSPDTNVNFLLERMALVSDENSSEDDVLDVMNEVNDWLSDRSDPDDSSAIPLRLALTALTRLKIHELERSLPASDVLENSRAVEQSFHSQLVAERNASAASRRTFDTTLRAAEENIRTLQGANNRLTASLQEEREMTDTFRSEVQTSRRRAVETLQSTQVLEDSLLARIRAIEMEYTSKLRVAEAEIALLRVEVSRQSSANGRPSAQLSR